MLEFHINLIPRISLNSLLITSSSTFSISSSSNSSVETIIPPTRIFQKSLPISKQLYNLMKTHLDLRAITPSKNLTHIPHTHIPHPNYTYHQFVSPYLTHGLIQAYHLSCGHLSCLPTALDSSLHLSENTSELSSSSLESDNDETEYLTNIEKSRKRSFREIRRNKSSNSSELDNEFTYLRTSNNKKPKLEFQTLQEIFKYFNNNAESCNLVSYTPGKVRSKSSESNFSPSTLKQPDHAENRPHSTPPSSGIKNFQTTSASYPNSKTNSPSNLTPKSSKIESSSVSNSVQSNNLKPGLQLKDSQNSNPSICNLSTSNLISVPDMTTKNSSSSSSSNNTVSSNAPSSSSYVNFLSNSSKNSSSKNNHLHNNATNSVNDVNFSSLDKHKLMALLQQQIPSSYLNSIKSQLSVMTESELAEFLKKSMSRSGNVASHSVNSASTNLTTSKNSTVNKSHKQDMKSKKKEHDNNKSINTGNNLNFNNTVSTTQNSKNVVHQNQINEAITQILSKSLNSSHKLLSSENIKSLILLLNSTSMNLKSIQDLKLLLTQFQQTEDLNLLKMFLKEKEKNLNGKSLDHGLVKRSQSDLKADRLTTDLSSQASGKTGLKGSFSLVDISKNISQNDKNNKINGDLSVNKRWKMKSSLKK